ncbi:MAG: branched-chain amino acid ABC transporter permease [Dehalococcoidia bacterium]
MSILSRIPWAGVVAIFVVGFLVFGVSYEQTAGALPDGNLSGAFSFFVLFLTFVMIYSIFTLGLNTQWGYAGVFNFGVLAFFMVGAYTTAIFVKPPAEGELQDYIGGFGDALNFAPGLQTDQWFVPLVGTLAAGIVSGILALLVSIPTLRLREDYLAIATIGVAELVRRIAIEETWLVNGTRGITGIPLPLRDLVSRGDEKYLKLAIAAVVMVLIFIALERAVRSPWGRVLLGLREDELATAASGKNVTAFKQQSFVLGAVIMGIGGSVYAYTASSLTANSFDHFTGTFLFWAMLMVGGSGNNTGAVAGVFVLWGFWILTLQIQGYDLGDALLIRVPYIREFVLGLLIVLVVLFRPTGLLPQEPRVSIWVERRVRALRAAASRPVAASAEAGGGDT